METQPSDNLDLEMQLFAQAFKDEGAISYFHNNVDSEDVGLVHGNKGINQFYLAMHSFHERTGLDPVEPIAFRSWIEADSDIHSLLGGKDGVEYFFGELDKIDERSTPQATASVLKMKGDKRRQGDYASELTDLLDKKDKTNADRTQIRLLTAQIQAVEDTTNKDPFAKLMTGKDFAEIADSLWDLPDFLPTQFEELNKSLGYTSGGGFCKGALSAILAQSGQGKALALDTPIPTPLGWTTMGSLAVGDKVYGSNGAIQRVANVSEVFTGHECYRVSFSDGSSMVADAGHRWEVHRISQWVRPKVVTTEEIFGYFGKGTIRLPIQGPLEGGLQDLIINPYVLGAWLGDGHSAGARITSADPQIIEEISLSEPVHKAKGKGEILYNLTEGKGSGNVSKNPFSARLRSLGVLDNKHIPTSYLRASYDQRLSLLQGLMDTDGSVYENRNSISIEYSSKSKLLADGVVELIRSLGIRVSVRECDSTLHGRYCGPRYRIRFLTKKPVFRLKRKLDLLKIGSTDGYNRTITNIVKVNSVPTKCIEVDSPDHLFLAGDGMVPTHNSTLAKNLANNWASNGYRVLFINFEETRDHWSRILMTQVTGHNVYMGEDVDEQTKKLASEEFKERMLEWNDNLMVLQDPDSQYFEDLEAWLRTMQKTDRVPDVIIIDTIQSMFMRKSSGGARWNQYEEMMVKLEKLAKDLGSAIILTAQENTNRMKEARDVVKQSDAGGSIAIVQKCSVTIHIVSQSTTDDAAEEGLVELQIPKNRITGKSFALDPPIIKYVDEIKSYVPYETVSSQRYDESDYLDVPGGFSTI